MIDIDNVFVSATQRGLLSSCLLYYYINVPTVYMQPESKFLPTFLTEKQICCRDVDDTEKSHKILRMI